jgi:hypothetical protein
MNAIEGPILSSPQVPVEQTYPLLPGLRVVVLWLLRQVISHMKYFKNFNPSFQAKLRLVALYPIYVDVCVFVHVTWQ